MSTPFPAQTAGLRPGRSGVKRDADLQIYLTEEEREAIFAVAAYTGDSASSWARDVLLSRAAGLLAQRRLEAA